MSDVPAAGHRLTGQRIALEISPVKVRTMNDSIDKWGDDFAIFLTATLEEFRAQTTEQMDRFAVDCHPWNGIIILAFLTRSEAEESPHLNCAEEMASWKFYDFGSVLSEAHLQFELGSNMRKHYEQEREDKPGVAECFFLTCATIVANKTIRDVLSKFYLSRNFEVAVRPPDTGKEYFTPPH